MKTALRACAGASLGMWAWLFALTGHCFRCHSCAERGQTAAEPPKKSARADHHDRLGGGSAVARSGSNFSGPGCGEETAQVKVVEVPDRGNVHQDHAGISRGHRLVMTRFNVIPAWMPTWCSRRAGAADNTSTNTVSARSFRRSAPTIATTR